VKHFTVSLKSVRQTYYFAGVRW